MEEMTNAHCRVLIIEDDPCYQKLIERYVRRCGATVRIAADGRTGLEKALTGDYDLVFVDIQLPQLDGFMVATLLREQDDQIPLIAMTSLRLEGMGLKASAVGFNEFLCKPVSEHTVARLIDQYSPVVVHAADNLTDNHAVD